MGFLHHCFAEGIVIKHSLKSHDSSFVISWKPLAHTHTHMHARDCHSNFSSQVFFFYLLYFPISLYRLVFPVSGFDYMSGAIHLSSAMKRCLKDLLNVHFSNCLSASCPVWQFNHGYHCALRLVVDHDGMWLAGIAFSQYLLSYMFKRVSS